LGYQKIATQLLLKKSCVAKILKKYKKHGTVADLPVSGQPRCSAPRMDRDIIRKIEENPRLSAPVINVEMKVKYGLQVSTATIRNRIREVGLKRRAMKKKPFLSKRHIALRLNWAKKHEKWTLEDWKRVIWSDETKINLFGSDGVSKVWRRSDDGDKAKYCRLTIKHGGGNRMVWACMSWKGVGNFEILMELWTRTTTKIFWIEI